MSSDKVALPPPIGGALGAGLLSVLMFTVPVVFAVALEPLVKPEAVLAAKIDLADPLAAPIAAAVFHFVIVQWLALLVNSARRRYSVPWPTMYAEASQPHAHEYNCCQRAHQHVLEQTPMLLTLLFVSSLEFPLTAGACAALFSFSKVVGNVFGYSRGNVKAKNRGGFGYLGLLALIGLTGLVVLRKAGVAERAASKVESAVAAAKPMASSALNMTIEATYDAYEAAKPKMYEASRATYEATSAAYVSASAAAAPIVFKAYEPLKPYVDQAHAACKPYLESAYAGYTSTCAPAPHRAVLAAPGARARACAPCTTAHRRPLCARVRAGASPTSTPRSTRRGRRTRGRAST